MGYYTITQVYKPGGITNASGTPNLLRTIDGDCVKVTWTNVQIGGLQLAEIEMVKPFEDTTDLVAGDWFYFAANGGTLNSANTGDTSITVYNLGDSSTGLAQTDIQTGDFILISNGVTTDLMKVSSVSGTGPWTIGLTNAPGQNTSSLLNTYGTNTVVARLQFSGYVLSRDTRTTQLNNKYTVKVNGFGNRYNSVLCNADIVQQDSATSIYNLINSYAATIPEIIVSPSNFISANGIHCGDQSQSASVLKVVSDILKTENSANASSNFAFWVDAARQAKHQAVPGANTITGSGSLGVASNLLVNSQWNGLSTGWSVSHTHNLMTFGTDLRYDPTVWGGAKGFLPRYYVWLNQSLSDITNAQTVSTSTGTTYVLSGTVGIANQAVPSGGSVTVRVIGNTTSTTLATQTVSGAIAQTNISMTFSTGTNTSISVQCYVSTNSIPWTVGATDNTVCLASFAPLSLTRQMAAPSYSIDVVTGNSYGDSLGPLEVTDMDITNMVNTALVTGGQVSSTKQSLQIIVQDKTSQAAWGYYEGTLSNTNLTDEATAAAWAAGQLNLTAYPLTTAKVTFVSASCRLTCQDLLQITGFTDGSVLQLNPVQIQYVADHKNRVITGTAQLTQARPDIAGLLNQGAAQHAIRTLYNLPKTNIDAAYVVSGLGLSVSGLNVTVAAGVVSYGGTLYNIPQATFTLTSNDVIELGVQVTGTPPTGVTLPAVVEKPNVTALSTLHANNVYSITHPVA